MDEKECEFNTLNGGCELSLGGVCKNVLNCYFKENKQLTEQLSIAREALKLMANTGHCLCVRDAKQALAKIEEVKC